MTRLLRVELARYRSRRVIALLLLLAALVAALVAAKSAWDTRPITAQELMCGNQAGSPDHSATLAPVVLSYLPIFELVTA